LHIASVADVNLALAGLLFDLAFLAGENQRSWGYKRAAKAVLRLDRQITPLVEANTFRAIPGIGPTTDRIARELIYGGTSAFVEQAVQESGKADKVEALRSLRRHFLSRAAVNEILDRARRRSQNIAATFRCTRCGATAPNRSIRSSPPAWGMGIDVPG